MLVGLAVTATSSAQDGEVTARLEKQLRQAEQSYMLRINPQLSATERALIDYGAVLTFGFLAVDDLDQQTHLMRQYDAQLYGYVNVDGVHEAFGRLRFTYRDFNEGDAFDERGDYWDYPLSDRWWYRFDLGRAIEAYEGRRWPHDLTVKIGRQYIDWGSGLTLSEQLYAALVAFEWDQAIEVRGLVGLTPASSVVDFDSSRPSFDSDTDRLFAGGQVAWTGWQNHQPYAFVLVQRDQNDEDQTDFDDLPIPYFDVHFHYDSTYWGIGSRGELLPRLRYRAEFVYETGSGLSSPYDPVALVPVDQTEEDIRAWAARLELSYHLLDENLTELAFEALVASGDDDRDQDTSNTFGGNRSGTDDTAFNGFGFINTGLAFAPAVSNLTMFRVGGSTFPLRDRSKQLFRRFQVGADAFFYLKTDADAPFDEPTNDQTWLGFEVDVYANWRIASDLAVFGRYGVFFPGDGIDGDSDERHFLYTGVTYSF